MRSAGVLAVLAVVGFLAEGSSAGSGAGYSMEVLVDGRPAAELPTPGRPTSRPRAAASTRCG
jgi:hypothetical protein